MSKKKEQTKAIYGCDTPVILAPMAGITDLPFRLLCKEQGCDVMVTEMISCKALFYGNKNTKPLMEKEEMESPIGIQLFGSEPELMAQMAQKVEHLGFAFIDLNMGCPVPKIVNNHEGSSLMLNPELAGNIVREISQAVSLPVTVKIRKGFDEDHINAPDFARVLADNGAAAIAVHGRTRQQYYTGDADWDIIRQVKENVDIPVIANGDVKGGEDALRILQHTGCDGLMVGRGAKGNPWIFREIRAALKGEAVPARPDFTETLDMLLRHARLNVKYKDEIMGIREMRKHAAWYTAGLHGSAKFRDAVNHVNTLEEFEKLVDSLTNRN